MSWEPSFAWIPTQTLAGRWVWLRKVERRWNWKLNDWGYGGYSGTDGGWEYRLPTINFPSPSQGGAHE